MQRPQQRLGMKDADDVFRLFPPQGNAGEGAGQHLVDHGRRRLAGFDHDHGLAVDHDLAHLHVGQIQDAAQHGAFLLDRASLSGVEIDGAAQFGGRRTERLGGVEGDSEQPEHPAHHEVHGAGCRRQREHKRVHDRRAGQRHPVGVAERIGLGQDFREDQDQERHGDGGIGDAGLAEYSDEKSGGQRRGHDIDQVVAQQNGADKPFLLLVQAVDHARAAVAVSLQLVHERAGSGGQRRLGTGEKGGKNQQDGDGTQGYQHGCLSTVVGG